MPILARFLPTEPGLIDLALAFTDPHRAPRAKLFRRIRRATFYGLQLLTGWCFGRALAVATCIVRHDDVTWGMLLYLPLFFLCAWILLEMIYMERSYRRFGL